MRPITTDDPVMLYVYQSVTWLRCAKTAKRTKVRFGMETLRDAMHIVVDGGSDSPTARRRGRRFDAAVVKLLWPLVLPTVGYRRRHHADFSHWGEWPGTQCILQSRCLLRHGSCNFDVGDMYPLARHHVITSVPSVCTCSIALRARCRNSLTFNERRFYSAWRLFHALRYRLRNNKWPK